METFAGDHIMSWESFRLARLSAPAKMMITLFLALVGSGYLVATANIYMQHENADLEPGLTLNDLKRNFHGIEKVITPEAKVTVNSMMLEQVREGGDMREHLEPGGEPAIRALISWLENTASEGDFVKPALFAEGDPSAQQVITDQCVECHNADGGESEDAPFADTMDDDADFVQLADYVEQDRVTEDAGPKTLVLAPKALKTLVLITHQHILSIPVFTLIVGILFLMTGFSPAIKTILVPLPMLAVVADIGGWWAARYSEPFIYVIAAAGAVFGTTFGLQILGVLSSMWLGKKEG
jgi:hypothetical protein